MGSQETSEAKAQRIIVEELARLGWSQAELARRRKSDPAKLALAARLRNGTTLSIQEIAACLPRGKAKGAKSSLPQWMRGHTPQDPAQQTLEI